MRSEQRSLGVRVTLSGTSLKLVEEVIFRRTIRAWCWASDREPRLIGSTCDGRSRVAKRNDSSICRSIATLRLSKEKGSGSNRHDPCRGGCPHPPSGARLRAMHVQHHRRHVGGPAIWGRSRKN